jgi:hypothetical protein
MSREFNFKINRLTRSKEWYISLYVARPGYSELYLHPDLKLRGNMIMEVYKKDGLTEYTFGYIKTRKQCRQLIKDFITKVIESNIGQCYAV